MLQTIKELVVTMISSLTHQQMISSSFQDTFSTPHQLPTIYCHLQRPLQTQPQKNSQQNVYIPPNRHQRWRFMFSAREFT